MKRNMLQSFYNYIVDELLIGYFKKYPMQKGSRYFIIVENEKHREMLIQALNDAWNYLSKLHELEKEGDPSEPVTIQHTKVKGGSIETTTVMGKNPQQGGLLEKIFLGEAVDVEAEVIK